MASVNYCRGDDKVEQLFELMRKRASCRAFKKDEIDKNILKAIVEAGLTAASGGGLQPFSVIKITSKETKKKLMEYSRGQRFIENVPVVFMICLDQRRIQKMSKITPFPTEQLEGHFNMWMSIFDVGLMAQNMCLAAESYGLKSIFIGNFFNYLSEVSQLLEIPDYVVPTAMMCLGYPKTEIQPTKKYTADVIMHDEVYREMTNQELINSFNDKYGDFSVKLKEPFKSRFIKNCEKTEDGVFIKEATDFITDKGSLNFYQFFLAAYFEELDNQMSNEDYMVYLDSKGFNWF